MPGRVRGAQSHNWAQSIFLIYYILKCGMRILSTKRHEIDGKYAYDSSTIVFDFARLVKEGWLHLDELKGLKPEMLSKISALARM